MLKNVLSRNENGKVSFFCCGCNSTHDIPVDANGGLAWDWNRSMTKPTFTPSIKVGYNGKDAGQTDVDGYTAPPAICHSLIQQGIISYCGDSTHALSGQEVDLLPVSEWPR